MKFKWPLLVAVTILLAGCTDNSATISELESRVEELSRSTAAMTEEIIVLKDEIEDKDQRIGNLEQEMSALELQLQQQSALMASHQIMLLIKNQDWAMLSNSIHPSSGVRFSPYQYVDVTSDQVMMSAQVASIPAMSQVLTWGAYDGTGEPIDLSVLDYYDRFIYDQDFYLAPVIGNSSPVSSGNTINNIQTVYLGAVMVEYYYPQIDPQYMGMDWRSLTLVLEDVGGTYYLIGVVHGEWTI